MKLQMASPASTLTPLLFSGMDQEQKQKIQKPPSFQREITMGAYIAQFEIVTGINQWNDEQKGNYLLTSLKGSVLTVLWNLATEARQYDKALVAAPKSRFGSAHRAEFKSRLRCYVEWLQEFAKDREHLARLTYPLVMEDMKDLLAKEQFIDAIIYVDAWLLVKQSKP